MREWRLGWAVGRRLRQAAARDDVDGRFAPAARRRSEEQLPRGFVVALRTDAVIGDPLADPHRRDQQRRKERAQEEYTAFRQNRAEELFAAALPEIRKQIEAEALVRAQAKRSKFGRTTDAITLRFERLALVEKFFGLPSFKEWASTLRWTATAPSKSGTLA